MIGRAAIGYPWIFREIKHFFATGQELSGPTLDERIDACLTHFEKSVEWKGEKLGVLEMRRHYSNYFKGLPNFKELRMKLVNAENADIVRLLMSEIAEIYVGH
jgi:tRNA-dihydrouridine synthase